MPRNSQIQNQSEHFSRKNCQKNSSTSTEIYKNGACAYEKDQVCRFVSTDLLEIFRNRTMFEVFYKNRMKFRKTLPWNCSFSFCTFIISSSWIQHRPGFSSIRPSLGLLKLLLVLEFLLPYIFVPSLELRLLLLLVLLLLLLLLIALTSTESPL